MSPGGLTKSGSGFSSIVIVLVTVRIPSQGVNISHVNSTSPPQVMSPLAGVISGSPTHCVLNSKPQKSSGPPRVTFLTTLHSVQQSFPRATIPLLNSAVRSPAAKVSCIPLVTAPLDLSHSTQY